MERPSRGPRHVERGVGGGREGGKEGKERRSRDSALRPGGRGRATWAEERQPREPIKLDGRGEEGHIRRGVTGTPSTRSGSGGRWRREER